LREIAAVQQPEPQTFKFLVEFNNRDGSHFELGPCCGEDPNSRPPITQFEFNVVKTGDRYLVQDLPVYVP
jgi:hypothetical protein